MTCSANNDVRREEEHLCLSHGGNAQSLETSPQILGMPINLQILRRMPDTFGGSHSPQQYRVMLFTGVGGILGKQQRCEWQYIALFSRQIVSLIHAVVRKQAALPHFTPDCNTTKDRINQLTARALYFVTAVWYSPWFVMSISFS